MREQRAEQPSGDLLGHAVRVHVGRVEERDPGLDAAPNDRLGRGLIQMPLAFLQAAVAHHAQADPRDLQPRRSESHVLHIVSFCSCGSLTGVSFSVDGDGSDDENHTNDLDPGRDLGEHHDADERRGRGEQ